MTTYTADDFKRAEFARHPDGWTAARVKPSRHPGLPWADRNGFLGDDEMAREGWVPVQEARPLTAADITDEMVQRAFESFADDGVGYLPAHERVRNALTAALTEPPARPEGAEELQELVEMIDGGSVSSPKAERIADFLAERGVRVTGGE